MDGARGRSEAVLACAGVEFAARDATLLRRIDATGSVAKASSALGRSRARDLSRIEELETAFGDLVERRRGGPGGGGSRLTANAERLLDRYDRLRVALAATARVPETVLDGTVEAVAGELADVATAVGTLRGLHDGVETGDRVQVRVGADTLTVLDPDADPAPDSTSARNRLSGEVSDVDRGETVRTVTIDVDGTAFRALVTAESTHRLGIERGAPVVVTWKATATRLAGR